ncbi:uncharacterized protein KY384_004219 [Bacidia gigantensis]|uniref:uncharacterized protein n=1 Tax=Bacidia gigantensis TaxID=2732470 RepID=UPI001D05442A|nr:uncharacterized protein KY384_004219 [Bacidia gigantensis]KAG8530862.1 hypothetical protein KY384_004219 [Bacidia gigantensis]
MAEVSLPPHDNKFLQYMSSAESSAFKPAPSYSLEHPLSNYFINSSHNTYLTGNQLYSDASTAPYTTALLRGCRCIEIDVWNGEPHSPKAHSPSHEDSEKKGKFKHYFSKAFSTRKSRDDPQASAKTNAEAEDGSMKMPTPWTSASTTARAEPRVLHGYTLTKEIPFRNVCSAIMDAAFVNSDLPIIISLEVHAGPEQQEIMVEIIQSTFKGHLVSAPPDEDLSLPSPSSLRRKVLIKVKFVHPKKATETEPGKENNLGVKSLPKKRSKVSIMSSSSSSTNDVNAIKAEAKKKKSSIIPSLSALGIYTRSYHFSNLSSPDALVPTHVFSLSEKKLMEVHESSGPTLFSHNRNFLMRAFPSGLRVRSDNLDPSIFWRKGVQIVALNWQRWDQGMMLNNAMFDGSSGWVLKPEGYLGARTIVGHPNSNPGPRAGEIQSIGKQSQADAIVHKNLSLSLRILAGQDLPLPSTMKSAHSFRPYLKVELHVEKTSERTGAPIENDGKAKDEEDGKFKHTLKMDCKGSTEIDFNDTNIEFKDIPGVVESISFLRIKVLNDEMGKDPLAAWACARLDRLKEGWRFLHLMDSEGNECRGVLLLGIEKSLV